MCGRYTLTTPDLEALARVVQAEISPQLRAEYRPRYNIAPTQPMAIVCEEPEEGRRLDLGVWGLHLAGGRPGAQINVRAESAATAPSSREVFARGRCGVLADGFYEWSGPKEHRRPHWFHTPNGRLIVFAGIYTDVRDEQTGEVKRHSRSSPPGPITRSGATTTACRRSCRAGSSAAGWPRCRARRTWPKGQPWRTCWARRPTTCWSTPPCRRGSTTRASTTRRASSRSRR
nr:SOS response-associated peptidase family protein [Nannocystis pusilla]